jgi:hypothetical protein
MKKFFTFLFFLFLTFYSFAQFQLENINCIILIDGKLPSHLSGFVEYNNEFNQKDTAIFYYNIGLIRFKSTDFEKLRLLSDTAIVYTDTTSVIIHLSFSEWQKKYGRKTYHYSSSVPWIMLFYDRNSSIILSITNFDKKKGTYYFDWMVSNMAKRWQVGYNKKRQIIHDSNPYRPVKR